MELSTNQTKDMQKLLSNRREFLQTQSLVTPGLTVKPGGNPGDEKELGPRETSILRVIVARAQYFSQDRSDIKFATKELGGRMAKPRLRDVNAAKRLARYLSTRTTMICHFKKQKMPKEIEAWSDSDWAGCLETRKSISGGLIKFGAHIDKSCSITQNTIVLSSGEAEFYAMVKAGSQGAGIWSMLDNVGISSNVKIITDPTAARGMAQREALGAVRHVEVHQLWIQDEVQSKEICVERVGGKSNLADGPTKFVDGKA